MTIKSLVRKVIPARFQAKIGNALMKRRERYLSSLSLPDAFNEVYRQGMWRQGHSPSGKGSEGVLADRYIALVEEYADRHQLRTVVDGGCGDFSVGSRLAPLFGRYTALDVSSRIIDINRKRYADLVGGHVSFEVGDMTATTFPAADLVLVRQVLQHLTNAQIEKILANLAASRWRRVLISESVHDPENNQTPNLDLPTHTVRTRTSLGSGVFLDKPPFNLPAKRIATIYSSQNGEMQTGGLLVLELSREP
jgi:hypothetical protein